MTTRITIIHTLILGLALAGSAMGQPSFNIKQLPLPDAIPHSDAHLFGVGSDGRMLAVLLTTTSTGYQSQCAEYKNGAWSVLATPGFNCYIHGVNKAGQFVGELDPPTMGVPPRYPYANSDGTFGMLLPPGLPYPATTTECSSGCLAFPTGVAMDINSRGDVLGYVDSPNATSSPKHFGWIYSGGVFQVLPPGMQYPYAFNDNGDVIGDADVGGFMANVANQHAFLLHNGTVTDLGTLGGASSHAYAINSSGQVTGCSYTTATVVPTNPVNVTNVPTLPVCIAFFYDGTGMKEIHIDGVHWASGGYSISDAGDVIGGYTYEFDATGALGSSNTGYFYYHAGTVYMLDSKLIANAPAGLVVKNASFLKGTNQIILTASLPDQPLAWFLLTPSAANTATPSITSVVNGASFTPNISAGSWITIDGGNLSTTTRQWASSDFVGGNLPTQLDGVSVTVNGIPAYPSFISPTQINLLTPDDVTTGQVEVKVTNAQGTSNAFLVQKSAEAPAFFVVASTYAAGTHATGVYPVATHASGVLVGPAWMLDSGNCSPAAPGETIQLFGTGFGATAPVSPAGKTLSAPARVADSVTVTIGGQPATVTFAGLTSNGLYQLNVVVPPGLSSGDAAVVASIHGVSTQANIVMTVQ